MKRLSCIPSKYGRTNEISSGKWRKPEDRTFQKDRGQMNFEELIKQMQNSETIKEIHDKLLAIVMTSEVASPEWNYAWDLLRNHIDHFKYLSLERKDRLAMERMNTPQPPLKCCQN